MLDPASEQEFREEAELLAKLPPGEQAVVIAWHRDIASNPKLRKADREAARQRADALERLLKSAGKKRKDS